MGSDSGELFVLTAQPVLASPFWKCLLQVPSIETFNVFIMHGIDTYLVCRFKFSILPWHSSCYAALFWYTESLLMSWRIISINYLGWIYICNNVERTCKWSWCADLVSSAQSQARYLWRSWSVQYTSVYPSHVHCFHTHSSLSPALYH